MRAAAVSVANAADLDIVGVPLRSSWGILGGFLRALELEAPLVGCGSVPLETQLLPPFPDELVMARDKGRVIGWLKASELPSRYARAHLRRWGLYAGIPITYEDYQQVARDVPPRLE